MKTNKREYDRKGIIKGTFIWVCGCVCIQSIERTFKLPEELRSTKISTITMSNSVKTQGNLRIRE